MQENYIKTYRSRKEGSKRGGGSEETYKTDNKRK